MQKSKHFFFIQIGVPRKAIFQKLKKERTNQQAKGPLFFHFWKDCFFLELCSQRTDTDCGNYIKMLFFMNINYLCRILIAVSMNFAATLSVWPVFKVLNIGCAKKNLSVSFRLEFRKKTIFQKLKK